MSKFTHQGLRQVATGSYFGQAERFYETKLTGSNTGLEATILVERVELFGLTEDQWQLRRDERT